MDVAEINARWVTIGHPHAIADGKRWRFYCPEHDEKGPPHDTLHAAMNDALAHKTATHG
jgi:hypothetical protein